MPDKAHWEKVYSERTPEQVSWFQSEPQPSLSLIGNSGFGTDTALIDVGGGASTLVDHLLAAGWRDVTVLDLSAAALGHARQRLGERAATVTWIEADVTRFEPPQRYRLWHDRAVLHFLTDADDRLRYRDVLHRSLEPGGQVIIGAFALDGPEKCSGLPVVRYSADALGALLGDAFELVEQRPAAHHTPWQAEQRFLYCHFRHRTTGG